MAKKLLEHPRSVAAIAAMPRAWPPLLLDSPKFTSTFKLEYVDIGRYVNKKAGATRLLLSV